MKKGPWNIGLITFPISDAGITPLANLVDISHHLSNDTYLITGDAGYTFFKEKTEIHVYGVDHKKGKNAFTRIVNYVWTQLKFSHRLAKLSRNVDLWIFFIGGEDLLLPILTAKFFGKKVILVLAGFPERGAEARNDVLFKPLGILAKFGLLLSNTIIVYSRRIIKERRLGKYRSKIAISHRHFLDFNSFRTKRKIEERDNLVGYIGSLSEIKGVLNFIESIPIVVRMRRDIKFLIGGDGNLSMRIKEYLNENSLENKVEMVGWIPHKKIPDYLNKLRLLILPSHTEGLPNIMLEAMACGTPVLTTPVGAIPDVIENEKNGFLLENNSPKCIVKSILNIFDRKDLHEISDNGRRTVENNFTYEVVVEKYKEILHASMENI